VAGSTAVPGATSSLVIIFMPDVVGQGTKIANKILNKTDPISKCAPASTLSSRRYARVIVVCAAAGFRRSRKIDRTEPNGI